MKHFTPPRHPQLGNPSCAYVYRDENAAPVLIVNRYDEGEGRKTFRPFTVATGDWKLPELRPLYNLDKLATAPKDTPVIVVEGEKCADALASLGFLVTTVCGGCNGVKKADLSPLFGRTVYIWPDHDEPGEKYAKVVETVLSKQARTRVAILRIVQKTTETQETHSLPKGWDCADAIAEGWTAKDVATVINSAPLFPQETARNDKLPETGMALWHTPEKEAFATITRDGHREHWSLDSTFFRNFLAHQHYRAEGKMLSQSALEDQRRTMTGEALFDGPEHRVFTRIGQRGDALHIDLGNADWQAVEVTGNGWLVTSDCPTKFRRSGSLRPLPYPVNGAGIDALRPFLNVATETDFQMLVAWLVGCFQPKGPYPILILTGEQGSAKSTTSRALRSLIDPANPMTRSAPQSEQDLVIAAQHNHVLAFDNLSYMKPMIADALCRIATGGGFGTRKLHTNTEEVLFDATRPCILNGIPDLASRPDLADRSIIVSLPVIDGTRRQFEGDFWRAFNQVAPAIFAALLDAASCALKGYRSVTLSERPRMADFARWVTAAEPVFGWEPGTFADAYAANRSAVDTAAIEGNPVAEAVLSLTRDHGPWKGTATDLTKTLRTAYPLLTEDPLTFPRHPNKLSGELKRVQPLLRRQGITLTKASDTKGQRLICIKPA